MSNLQSIQENWHKLIFAEKGEVVVDGLAAKKRERLVFYREAIFKTLRETITSCYPISAAILGAQWPKLIREFLVKAPPQNHLLKFVSEEFYQFFKKCGHALKQRFPYLEELLDYELLELLLVYKEEDDLLSWIPGQARDDVEYPLFNPVMVIRQYAWPVHFISEKNCELKNLPVGQYYLCVYRDPKTLGVNFMEVNAGVYEWWREGLREPKAIEESLKEWLQEIPPELQGAFKEQFFAFVQEARERGIILNNES